MNRDFDYGRCFFALKTTSILKKFTTIFNVVVVSHEATFCLNELLRDIIAGTGENL